MTSSTVAESLFKASAVAQAQRNNHSLKNYSTHTTLSARDRLSIIDME